MTEQQWEAFKKHHHIGKQRIAPLAKTSTRSFAKYLNGDPSLREDAKARVERAIQVIVDNDIVWPRPADELSPGHPWSFELRAYRDKCSKCDELFKQLYFGEES